MSASGTISGRSIEKTLEIKARCEDVWRALTDAVELTRWFPMEARVKPGVGGSIWQAWRGEHEGTMPIAAWEPNRHLQLIWAKVDASGSLLERDTADIDETRGPGGVPIAVDFHLESKGGSTVLRLVHSGFGEGATWDGMFDGIRRGWNFELRGLRHYLENHLGVPRLVCWARQKLGACSLDDAWKRLMGGDGLVQVGTLAGKKEGDRYSITTATGDGMEGTVYVLDPPNDLCATVENLNNGLLRLRVDNGCGVDSAAEVNVWLSCYGMSQSEVSAFEERFGEMLRKLYPEALS